MMLSNIFFLSINLLKTENYNLNFYKEIFILLA